VRSCNITYKAPGRYGDVICCDAKVVKLTGAQVIFQQRVWNKATEQTLAEAEVVIVCLDKDFKPCPLPTDIRGKLL
jgi:YbgC/YbaW family acyl-CoA thioester hydrolase